MCTVLLCMYMAGGWEGGEKILQTITQMLKTTAGNIKAGASLEVHNICHTGLLSQRFPMVF